MAEATMQELEGQLRKLNEQNHELSERIAVLEQKMETQKQEYKTDIAMLAEKMDRRDNMLLAVLGGLAVATAVLGLLINAQ
ncbi:MAG: hypothetical protein OXD44_08675 [Gammaproteobacteria bacterium]|nr:hypothetical protein [Gammaproteobacteria bacterium]MCY4313749.1 hypothetical protein [Gammaproteobacteria bacterium]